MRRRGRGRPPAEPEGRSTLGVEDADDARRPRRRRRSARVSRKTRSCVGQAARRAPARRARTRCRCRSTTPQPCAASPDGLTARKSTAGTSRPPSAADDRAPRARRRSVSSPTEISRRTSRPTTKKNSAIRPSLTQCRRSSRGPSRRCGCRAPCATATCTSPTTASWPRPARRSSPRAAGPPIRPPSRGTRARAPRPARAGSRRFGRVCSPAPSAASIVLVGARAHRPARRSADHGRVAAGRS